MIPQRSTAKSGTPRNAWIWLLLLWLASAAAVPVWVAHDSSAWDVQVYREAQKSLAQGHDPYSDAMAVQHTFHARILAHTLREGDEAPPYSYVYSPITLPVLRVLDRVPERLLGGLYWTTYVLSVLATVGVCVWLGVGRDRRLLLYLGAVACFFPGLLANGTVLSGNVAYLLYAAVLVTAWLGWTRDRWLLFYVAVLAASCVKAPLLSLALIPALSARRQWVPAVGTMIAGLGLFVVQPLLWPSLFQHYLQAVELQFSYNHDFGCGPAGLFSQALARVHLPYAPASYFFYLGYAIPLFAGLVYFSRLYLRGAVPLREWVPVLLVGLILLNPRIMEYDVAPVTLPLALIAWRTLRTRSLPARAAALMVLVAMNAAALYSWEIRKAMDGPLVVIILLMGAVRMVHIARESAAASAVTESALSAAHA